VAGRGDRADRRRARITARVRITGAGL